MRNRNEVIGNKKNVMVVKGTDRNISLYNREDKVRITKDQYHNNKNNFEKTTQIIAIAQRFGNTYSGYNYYAAPEILEQLK